jgi:single-strand DNA-binding protein
MNSVLVEGYLVRDPLFRLTPKWTPLCTFSIASNRFYRADNQLKKEVSFLDIESWSKTAEWCRAHGHKGRGVRVIGRIKQNRWTGPDGAPRSKVILVADVVQFRPEFSSEEGFDSGEGDC